MRFSIVEARLLEASESPRSLLSFIGGKRLHRLSQRVLKQQTQRRKSSPSKQRLLEAFYKLIASSYSRYGEKQLASIMILVGQIVTRLEYDSTSTI